jgi:hypothetical protein
MHGVSLKVHNRLLAGSCGVVHRNDGQILSSKQVLPSHRAAVNNAAAPALVRKTAGGAGAEWSEF